ncbi:MAG: hypothetical protein EOO80_21950, partial [Oxalobacteraceae bacterium]
LHNIGGKIRALGDSSMLNVVAADIDNSGGRIVNTGGGATIISATGEIINANPAALEGAGVIGGNGDVTVNAAVLRNLQAARLTAGGALTLNPTVLLDNSGRLLAGGMLRMKQAAASLINRGEISGHQVDLAGASLDNTRGLIANPKGSGGHITINTGTLVNTAGRIASDHDLWLTAVTLQGKGHVAGGRDATVSLQGDYTNEAGNVCDVGLSCVLSESRVISRRKWQFFENWKRPFVFFIGLTRFSRGTRDHVTTWFCRSHDVREETCSDLVRPKKIGHTVRDVIFWILHWLARLRVKKCVNECAHIERIHTSSFHVGTRTDLCHFARSNRVRNEFVIAVASGALLDWNF